MSVIFASGFSVRMEARLPLRKSIHAVDARFGWFGSFTSLPFDTAFAAFTGFTDAAASESTTSSGADVTAFGLRPRFFAGSSFFRSDVVIFPFLEVPVTDSMSISCSIANARALRFAKLSLPTGADASDSLSETDVKLSNNGAARDTERRTGAPSSTSITAVRSRLNAEHNFDQSDIVNDTMLILREVESCESFESFESFFFFLFTHIILHYITFNFLTSITHLHTTYTTLFNINIILIKKLLFIYALYIFKYEKYI